jgi:hypothetical protein
MKVFLITCLLCLLAIEDVEAGSFLMPRTSVTIVERSAPRTRRVRRRVRRRTKVIIIRGRRVIVRR